MISMTRNVFVSIGSAKLMVHIDKYEHSMRQAKALAQGWRRGRMALEDLIRNFRDEIEDRIKHKRAERVSAVAAE